MRPLKGGVWKNTEDEILKAAVMKYGMNQWARISSLLNRKTPKQCKARWYEWLDPSIKKTEWSREEDEKLLHLAKLMPTQWRTIAPIVGRTAHQCLERYQLLLDEAEQRELQQQQSGGPSAAAPSTDDVRKLRAGETDPNPESKPARPDAVDMDEDEKEMLAEARARLLNTQGKKAKRKARERQLEQARRAVFIDKRRELKSRGVMIGLRTKRRGEMDYNEEIPFQLHPPTGLYDVEDERTRPVEPVEFVPPPPPKDDKRKKEEEDGGGAKSKNKRSVKFNLPQDDGEDGGGDGFQVKRRKLMLPTPQIGQQEVEELVKLDHADGVLREAVDESSGNNEATMQLMGEREDAARQRLLEHRQTPALHRTLLPERVVDNEASNLLALQNAQTPLLGGHNMVLNEGGTGFDGVTPHRATMQTPNVLAGSSVRGAGAYDSATMARSVHGGESVAPSVATTTGIRDRLRINRFDGESSSSFVDAETEAPAFDDDIDFGFSRQNDLAMQKQLELGLLTLPKPKNDFEIVLPDEDEHAVDVVDDSATREEDREEVEARRRAHEADMENNRLALRSEPVKRGLPIPYRLATEDYDIDQESSTASLIQREYRRLVRRDVNDDDDDTSVEDDLTLIAAAKAILKEETKSLTKADVESLTLALDERRARWFDEHTSGRVDALRELRQSATDITVLQQSLDTATEHTTAELQQMQELLTAMHEKYVAAVAERQAAEHQLAVDEQARWPDQIHSSNDALQRVIATERVHQEQFKELRRQYKQRQRNMINGQD